MLAISFIVFFISAYCILHTYLFYPVWMINKKLKVTDENNTAFTPQIAIVFAAYNEELVIEAKLKSIYESNYPQDKLKIYIGSDSSTDNTDAIVERFQQKYSNIFFKRFTARTGKTNIVNDLVSAVKEPIMVLTDANVMFDTSLLQQLISPLQNEKVGIVGAYIIKQSVIEEGIARQEKTYMQLENKLKLAESLTWQLVMGVEGGCYAIKRNCFEAVPSHFQVDDFYITLSVLQKKYQVLFNDKAICYEDVPTNSQVEFKRKVRISTGNFQNLKQFKSLLFPPFSPLAFAFLSHKVLRWLTPFFLITCFLSSLYLAICTPFFILVFLAQVLLLMVAIMNMVFAFSNKVLKYISHFYSMNLALLIGFFRFAKGVNTSIWEPTKRNV
jgi:cellulose synthase/poly-beta-1,6-N-acetylglucosamine synthase-like glycosyltransferase